MSQNDRTQLIPDPQQPSGHTGGVQSPRPIAPSRRSTAWCGKRFPTPEPTATAASTTSAAPGKRQCSQAAPTHARGDHGPARKSAGNNKSGKKTTLFVVLGLIVIVYIVGIVAFSQPAYPPTPPLPASTSRFSNASSAATKVNLGMEAL